MQKVLFSHSYFYQLDEKQWRTGMPYPPLGTITAASYVRKNGFDVDLFDVCLEPNHEGINGKLDSYQPNYLVLYDDGFNYLTKMCLTNMRDAAFKMIQIAKDKGCVVYVNSSDSTDHFKKYIEAGADAVILGEGEETLLDLLGGAQRETIKGICYKNDAGSVINKGRRIVTKDLDKFPIAAWDLVDIQSYKNKWAEHGNQFALNLATTRGCPYKCNWCAKPIYGNRYNSRSPEHVVSEIKLIKESFNVSNFWMCDDIYGLKPGWVQKFDKILKSENIQISYKIQSRADLLLKEDNIDALVSSGLKEVWIGAESGSQRILDAMDKGTTVEQIEESTKILQKKGVRVAFFIQYGYLDETKEEVHQTIKMIKKLNPDNIGISVSYPLPGTKFYETVKTEMTSKQNWTDSDDLAMMFQGTFNKEYYRLLHSYTHKIFHEAKGFKSLKRIFTDPKRLSKSDFKSMIRLPYYSFKSFTQGKQLRKMENQN